MKLQLTLCSTLCSFLISLPVFAQNTNNTEKPKNAQEGTAHDFVENVVNEDEDGDFPDEPFYPPAEGREKLPWEDYIGYDEGFFFRNEDNTFSLVFNGLLQARYYYSQAEHQSDFHRFSLRRTDLYFSGHFIDESWQYVLGTEAGPNGDLALDDVYIAKNFNDYTWAQVGQFSTPFLREDLISSTRQLAVERSLVTKYFSTANSTGILFGIENEEFKWEAAAVNGYFEHNPDENQDVVDHDFQDGLSYAFLSCLKFKPFGYWIEFRGYNSFGENDLGLLIGIAGGYEKDNDEANEEQISGTIDVTFQGSGWSTFAMAVASRDTINDDNTSYGAQIQGGLFVDEEKDEFEIFSRYEWGDSSASNVNGEPNVPAEDLSILTAGFNWFIYPRNLKFTTDLGYAFTSIGENWSAEADGWRATNDSGQWVGRAQLQLVI